MEEKYLMRVGAAFLLLVIFGVPAVLVPFVMDNVPDRSMTRVVTLHSQAVAAVRHTFEKQANVEDQRRVAPVPGNTYDWIALVNPMGRKAPGGGVAFLPEADDTTGAIGLAGDAQSVTITVPAYRDLTATSLVITAGKSP